MDYAYSKDITNSWNNLFMSKIKFISKVKILSEWSTVNGGHPIQMVQGRQPVYLWNEVHSCWTSATRSSNQHNHYWGALGFLVINILKDSIDILVLKILTFIAAPFHLSWKLGLSLSLQNPGNSGPKTSRVTQHLYPCRLSSWWPYFNDDSHFCGCLIYLMGSGTVFISVL